MPEKIEPRPEEIPELPVSPQEVQIEAPSFLDKLKIHKWKIFGGILGILVFAGAIFGAYKLGQKQPQPFPQPTPGDERGVGERVFCKDPRPEVCTMECINNPPYICGSDGKSYCSECQACAHPKVKWYVIQDAPCGFGEAATKEECFVKGGEWRRWGLMGREYCQIPASDGGKPCFDGSECSLEKCITTSNELPGQCQTFKNTFGCFSFVEDGEIGRKICLD